MLTSDDMIPLRFIYPNVTPIQVLVLNLIPKALADGLLERDPTGKLRLTPFGVQIARQLDAEEAARG